MMSNKETELNTDVPLGTMRKSRPSLSFQSVPADIHIDNMTDLQLKKLIYELQMHQLELSIQNDELRETQLRLAEARDQYLALYDRAPVAYLTLSDSGHIGSCNLATSRLLGVSRNELIGRNLQEFVCQESQQDFHLHRQQLLNAQTAQAAEVAVNTPQGHISVRMESQCVLPEDAGNRLSWHVALSDITAQKQLQQKLATLNRDLEHRVAVRTQESEDSRQQLDAILNALPDAVVTFDDHGRIEHVNWATERLLEYARGELIGMNIRALIPLACEGEHERFSLKWLHDSNEITAPVYRSEIYANTKSVSQIPVTVSIARVDHKDRFTAILRDIRDIKSLQREVLKTTELERSRISQEFHDSLGQDLVGMSMLARSLAAEHANGSKIEQQESQCLYFSHMLDKCVNELRQIIFDLAPLDLNGGSLPVALQKLVDVVNKNTDIHCTLTCKTIDERVLVGTFPEMNIQFLRIAREAVHNAIKHAQANNIDITFETGKEFRLVVADDGKGMPADGAIDPKSQGIRIMNYRANVLGGKLLVEPNAPSGTRVVCAISFDK